MCNNIAKQDQKETQHNQNLKELPKLTKVSPRISHAAGKVETYQIYEQTQCIKPSTISDVLPQTGGQQQERYPHPQLPIWQESHKASSTLSGSTRMK